MPIIATAGHVDHGKSTLVEALTGRDPDRWAEEKVRGLTIDLGFAWTVLGEGTEVGFVDVPGHERFIKNMLAGVGAVDVALFVVAADEGWMPQTEEHFAVLDLLEVHHGVIAITRVDLVDDDLRDLAVLDVDEHIAGTALSDWPIVPVSAVDGTGMDELRTALATALRGAGPPADLNRPRLWVDRSFVISGAGVVVTGTLVGGALRSGDEVELWPGRRSARIRGIQSHELDVDTAAAGTRTAINLVGLETGDVPRGTMLSAPGLAAPTTKLLVDLRLVRSLDASLSGRGAFHLHAGTGAWPVGVRVVGGDTIEGRGAAVVTLPEPLAFEIGDRIILREVGRRAVVAGGMVLDPAPAGRLDTVAASLGTLRTAAGADPDTIATTLLALRGTEEETILAAHTGGGRPIAALTAGGLVIAERVVAELTTRTLETVRAYQKANPLRPGVPKAEVASSIGVDQVLLDAVIGATAELVEHGAVLRTRDFAGGWGQRQEAEWEMARAALVSDGLAVRRAGQLNLDPETFHALLREGRLVRIADDLVYLPDQIESVTAGLAGLADGFTVAEFRDTFALSRRQAVPLLEWLDANGWTSRRGDARTVRRRRGPGSSDAPIQ